MNARFLVLNMVRSAVFALLLALAACAQAPQPAPERAPGTAQTPAPGGPEPVPGSATADESGFATDTSRKPVTAKREMVTAANPLAADVALAILRRGGNAIDAAIAAQAMLTLVEPQSSGIGGGGFLMHFNGKTGAISYYDGRETAPRATTENDFMDGQGQALPRDRYRVGGLSAAVPGTLRLLEMAHKAHGKLPWRTLFRPAIERARDGFEVSPRLHRSIAADRYLREYAAARAYLHDGKGEPLAVGTVLRNPELAETLTLVAERGADAFYSGTIAHDIAAAVAGDTARPGKMTAADVTAYKAKKRRQVCGPYRSWLVCGAAPPTAGGVTTLMTLALLERFDIAKLRPNSVEAVHLFAEAMRVANADRLRYVADPDFVEVPLAGMLNPRYLARRSAMIEATTAMRHPSPGNIPVAARRTMLLAPSEDAESPSTTHLNVIDKDGNAVAMTASIGGAFGSRLLVHGFFLNNHATDFSAVPRTESGRPKVNRPEGGKRPRSAQAPMLVFDGSGKLVLAVGSPGGPRIIAFVLKTIIAVLDWNMDVQAAVSLPNRAVDGDVIVLERGTELESLIEPLRAMGHEVRLGGLTSGLHGIAVKGGTIHGGADPRREGVARGD